MLKALVFLSVIVSLAYSAPYGGYGGQSHTMVSGGDLSLGVHETVTQAAYSASVEKAVSQASLIAHEKVKQAAYYAPAPALPVAQVESSHSAAVNEAVSGHSSGGY